MLDRLRSGHDRGIGGHDAVHVGPDLDLFGADTGTNDGRAVVGSSAAQRGRSTVGRATNETAEHDHAPLGPNRTHPAAEPRVGRRQPGRRLGKPVVGHHHVAGVDVHRIDPPDAEHPGHDHARDALTVRQDGVGAFPEAGRLGNLAQQSRQRLGVLGQQTVEGVSIFDGRSRHPAEFGDEVANQVEGSLKTPLRGGFDGGDEPIGRATDSGHHHHRPAGHPSRHDVGHPSQRCARPQRAAAELHDDHREISRERRIIARRPTTGVAHGIRWEASRRYGRALGLGRTIPSEARHSSTARSWRTPMRRLLT